MYNVEFKFIYISSLMLKVPLYTLVVIELEKADKLRQVTSIWTAAP